MNTPTTPPSLEDLVTANPKNARLLSDLDQAPDLITALKTKGKIRSAFWITLEARLRKPCGIENGEQFTAVDAELNRRYQSSANRFPDDQQAVLGGTTLEA